MCYLVLCVVSPSRCNSYSELRPSESPGRAFGRCAQHISGRCSCGSAQWPPYRTDHRACGRHIWWGMLVLGWIKSVLFRLHIYTQTHKNVHQPIMAVKTAWKSKKIKIIACLSHTLVRPWRRFEKFSNSLFWKIWGFIVSNYGSTVYSCVGFNWTLGEPTRQHNHPSGLWLRKPYFKGDKKRCMFRYKTCML